MLKQQITTRDCLIAIPLASSCLRRLPNLVCCVKNARSAFFTQHTKLFARRSRASTSAIATVNGINAGTKLFARRSRASIWQEWVKARRIRHALRREQLILDSLLIYISYAWLFSQKRKPIILYT